MHLFTMTNEEFPIYAHFKELLAALDRLVDGTAAVFVAIGQDAIWSASPGDEQAAALGALVRTRLQRDGPWGLTGCEALPELAVWIEPAVDALLPVSGNSHPDAQDAGEATVPGDPRDGAGAGSPPHGHMGALGVAKRNRSGASEAFDVIEVEAIRMFASLFACAAHTAERERMVEYQQEIEQLVSDVAVRLMPTTSETMQASLDWTVETLAHYVKADFAFLRRNDLANGVSVLVSEYPSRDAPDPDPLAVVAFDSDPMFAASRDLKMPLVIRTATLLDPDYVTRLESAGAVDLSGSVGGSGAAVPLVYGDVTEGLLAFVRFSDHDWAEHEINVLKMVASLLVHLTHRLEMEEEWRLRALTDDLTGLPNRRALLAEIERRRPTALTPLELIFFDLDRFKVMNDYLGHSTGDKVLMAIATRIVDWVRPGDFVARLGGDEFIILLGAHESDHPVTSFAEELLAIISLPTVIEGREIVHSASAGIATTTDGVATAEELLSWADIALYTAKRRGRNQIVVFDDELRTEVAERSEVEIMLRDALVDQQSFPDHEQLVVFYQPEFDLGDGRLTAVEALIRWNHPRRGLLSAGAFVPIAEETYLMPDLGHWVLQQACSQMAKWRAEHPRLDIVLRVNISPGELAVPGVVQRIRKCLQESGLPPELLCIEITESSAIIDVERSVHILNRLRALGVQLAIDDFGSGYSSMIQLKNLPVNILKIDRVFVDGIATDLTNQGIVESILRLGKAFGLEIVAEGPETRADLDELILLGCRRSQGFILACPAPAEELEPLLGDFKLDLANLTDWTPDPAVPGAKPE
jgi:diguanylate cyclase (GGDEF)-like protein